MENVLQMLADERRDGNRKRMEIIAETGYRDRMEKEVVPFLAKYRYCGFFCPESGQEFPYDAPGGSDAERLVLDRKRDGKTEGSVLVSRGDNGIKGQILSSKVDNRSKRPILLSKVYYESYRKENAKGTIVIVHGFSESAEKYVEMIYYFFQAGYRVYIMDLRGHGRSARAQEDLSMVHIDRYQHYLTDLEYLTEHVVKNEDRRLPMYLYGHSMGGGIGAAFLEWKPEIFCRGVLSSPMIQPLTGGIPIGIARGIAGIMTAVGRGGHYVPGHHAFLGDETFENSAATSAERYDYYARKRQKERLFQTNGASYTWLREAARLSCYILKKKNCGKIAGKVLVFQAEQEDYVDKAAQELFVSRVSGARLVPVAGTKHEIYMSDDEHMRQYLDEVLGFFAKEEDGAEAVFDRG